MRSKASSTFHMLLGVLRGLETQETLEGVCRGVTKGTPLDHGLGMLLFVIPTTQAHASPVWDLGAPHLPGSCPEVTKVQTYCIWKT